MSAVQHCTWLFSFSSEQAAERFQRRVEVMASVDDLGLFSGVARSDAHRVAVGVREGDIVRFARLYSADFGDDLPMPLPDGCVPWSPGMNVLDLGERKRLFGGTTMPTRGGSLAYLDAEAALFAMGVPRGEF